MVGLTGANYNRYKTILQAKRQLTTRPKPVTINGDEKGDREIDMFGEIKVKQLHQEQKRLSPEEKEIIIAEYSSGRTTYDLAKQFGCHRRTISSILKSHGVKVDKCKARKKLDVDKVIAMYTELHTSEEIAKCFGVSSQSILVCLRAHGVKIRGRWDYNRA